MPPVLARSTNDLGDLYHKKQAVLDWLPAHGSWLNQVEIWFSILSSKCLRRASVCSTQDLRALSHRFLTTWNMHFAHPFAWAYVYWQTTRRYYSAL
jgi:hypothetical protein